MFGGVRVAISTGVGFWGCVIYAGLVSELLTQCGGALRSGSKVEALRWSHQRWYERVGGSSLSTAGSHQQLFIWKDMLVLLPSYRLADIRREVTRGHDLRSQDLFRLCEPTVRTERGKKPLDSLLLLEHTGFVSYHLVSYRTPFIVCVCGGSLSVFNLFLLPVSTRTLWEKYLVIINLTEAFLVKVSKRILF